MRERLNAASWLPPAYAFVLSAVISAPAFAPGYLLHRDLVSTPRSYLTDTALGATDAAPRAVPQDAFLAVLSSIIDGGIVVKVLILGALFAAGLGADALVRTVLTGMKVGARVVAVTVAIWNPFVAERLLQGHWSLLTGYAGLLWAVTCAYSLRVDGRNRVAWAALALSLAAAALTPTGGLIALLGALVALADRGRSLVITAAVGIVANLPWLVAAVGGSVASDPDAVPAFAARAEPWLGTIGSLAGLGGIWNAEAVPAPRDTPFALVGTLILLGIVGIGAVQAYRAGAVAQRLAYLAGASIVIPALLATGIGLTVLEIVVETVPGAGLMRDTQKFVCLAVPFYVLGAAAGCRVVAKFQIPAAAKAAALVLVLLPLGWGVGGALTPVQLPAGWTNLAAILERSPRADVAVLPAGQFRLFDGGTTPVLDPAARLLPNDVLQTGELVVSGERINGESTRAIDAEEALLSGAAPRVLADLGVGYVVVERNTPGPLGKSAQTLGQLNVVYDDADLALYAVPGPIAESNANRVPAIGAHLLWAVLLVGASGATVFYVVRHLRNHQARHRPTID